MNRDKTHYEYMLVSGGADSVANLRTYLQVDPTNERELVAVYYEMEDTLRSQVEKQVVQRLASRYVQVPFMYSRLRGFGRGDAVAILAAFVDNFVCGHHTADETITLYIGLEAEVRDEYGSNLNEYREVLKHILAARRAYWEDEPQPQITIESLVIGLTKDMMVARCGDDDFWSCRYPQVDEGYSWNGCGHCHSCQQLAEVGLLQKPIQMPVGPVRLHIMPENPKYHY